jgi:hypothetical protein
LKSSFLIPFLFWNVSIGITAKHVELSPGSCFTRYVTFIFVQLQDLGKRQAWIQGGANPPFIQLNKKAITCTGHIKHIMQLLLPFFGPISGSQVLPVANTVSSDMQSCTSMF